MHRYLDATDGCIPAGTTVGTAPFRGGADDAVQDAEGVVRRVGQLLDYYAGLVEDRTRADGRFRGPVDYYLHPDEPAGRWWGRGLDALGLSGEVTGADLCPSGEQPRCAAPRR